MTKEEVLRLEEASEEAQEAAVRAIAESNADPTNEAKKAIAAEAVKNAEKALDKWKAAQKALLAVSPSDWRVILLGLYLAIILVASVFFLGALSMAERPEDTVGDLRVKCCGENDKYCSPAPTPTPSANTNTALANTTPTNATPTNTTTNTTAANQTANTSANRPANSTVAPNSNTTPANTQTPLPTPISNSSPEVVIPKTMCAQYFNRLSADGFLFLIVLFAGMVGATTRGVFSFIRHHGVGDFSFRWTWFYLLLPFSGAVVSLFLYFIIRGGFYGSPIGKDLTLNLFAFVAVGTLSGLFSENAMEKLRQVAEVLLTKVPRKIENPPKLNEPKNEQ